MSEPEGEEVSAFFLPKLQNEPSIGRESMDLDESWPVDPYPSSPFLLSLVSPNFSSDRPSSPLWIFSDSNGENPTDNPLYGGFRLPDAATADYPPIRSCNSDPIFMNPMEVDENTRLLPEAAVEVLGDENSDVSCVIKERMTHALRCFKESTEQHFLVQVWAPVKKGNRYVLTTSGQPFVLYPHSTGLLKYRTVSLMYVFSVDGESESDLGLPGRVFRKKLPEWTPNVQFYNSKEYLRLNHALHYDVRGTLALPVFEASGQSCLGVVELIMTAQKVNYALDVDKVCRALEAVNLKSFEILDHPNMRICNEGRQAALAEILEILSVVCEAHKLPLAQTWVPCRHRSVLANGGGSKKSCTSFDGTCMGKVCMSTSDVAFYVVDAHMWGFRDACAEHHLQKEQGVAGRAYASHRSCFSRDITRFSKTEYPLVHYARMFGLKSCLAICLRSEHTGNDDYILEFFFPPSCVSSREQNCLLDILSTTMKQCFQSLKAVSENELQEEKSFEIIEMSMKVEPDSTVQPNQTQSCAVHDEASPQTKTPTEVNELGFSNFQEGEVLPDLLEKHFSGEDEPMGDYKLTDVNGNLTGVSLSENRSLKMTERKRGKAEKSISLEVLQQYFAGSLKDAAKSLGGAKEQLGNEPCDFHQEGGKEPPTSITTESGDEHGAKRETMLEGCRLSAHQELFLDGSDSKLEIGKNQSQLNSGSAEESTEMPTSQDSHHGTAANGTHMSIPSVSSVQKQQVNMSSYLGTTIQLTEEPSLPTTCSVPDAFITTQPETLMSGLLIEDSGSCKDLEDLCNYIVEGCTESGWVHPCSKLAQQHSLMCTTTLPHALAKQDTRSLTIKASYKDDIIRFRLLITSTVLDLKMEVSRRLKLEVGTFDIKYLDDDDEWVLLACDADFQECMDISKSSGGHVIRLLVHDIVSNIGSSCGSSGE